MFEARLEELRAPAFPLGRIDDRLPVGSEARRCDRAALKGELSYARRLRDPRPAEPEAGRDEQKAGGGESSEAEPPAQRPDGLFDRRDRPARRDLGQMLADTPQLAGQIDRR